MAENTTSATSSTNSQSAADAAGAADIVGVLGNLLKNQTGEPVSNEKVAQLLLANMANLVRQGKLTQAQIMQLKQFADKHKVPVTQNQTPVASTSAAKVSNTSLVPSTATTTTAAAATPATPHTGFKTGFEAGSSDPTLASKSTEFWPPISQTLSTTNPGPVQWTQTRPTLTGGIPSGRMSGTPAQIARSDDGSVLNLDDNRSRRKNTPGDQSMRRTIQDLVASVDPNVKIEPEVEDLLLSIADEFIDSVTNFACRLAKHRGGDTLEVRDLQLHLERNHNIRIPGFASDETRISLSQSSVAPAPATTTKKTTQGTHMTLRSQRLAQVQHTKREAKLM
ncbi:hypothetical protein AMATHDRAFT_148081 [Amanita thiersii Skay4041]|uniref:TBP-associated factor 12 n=1 Tax=Amanita thiersii Skay4041 TaxID=703135 RepID=A0A2A9NGN5_9AGAR|nr:hypothetical protein AMATHDRAFT_148081 [Amanita thiersii Skay4041]